MKVIMYHYVRNENKEFPNFKALSEKTFLRQIDFFKNDLGIGTAQEFIEGIQNKETIDKYFLTFDDGFKEHYEFVFDTLEKNNVTAFFFPSTYPLLGRKVLGVHKIHMLIGKYNSGYLMNKVMKDIDTSMLDNSKIKEFDKEIYTDQINTPDQKKFKRLFNYYLKYDSRNKILDHFFTKYFDEESVFEKLYMTKDNIIEMFNAGHVIGSHTHNHRVMSRLSKEDQEYQIEKSENILASFLGKTWKDNLTFCYPYGGSKSFNEDTKSVLRKRGYDMSFMVGNVKINDDNVRYHHELKRIDCNRFLKV